MSIRPIASTYPTVGFFGRSSRSRPHNKQHKKKRGQVIPAADSTAIPDSETLLEFDSGRRMTFAQGTRSTLVIGGTGSGKTASVVLPMASNLIRAGFGGLILDVKGNLREQVRALAASHGRLDDIVEFGSAPNANRCNFLAGMAEHEIGRCSATRHVCRNLYFGNAERFDVYNTSKTRKAAEKNGITLDFPVVANRGPTGSIPNACPSGPP